MPLIKSGSKKAFEKNVKTEMEANPSKKDRAQNLAIAYNVQRQNKKKKMAEGGVAISAPAEHMVNEESMTPEEMKMLDGFRKHIKMGGTADNFSMEGRPDADRGNKEMLAEGGVADFEHDKMVTIDDEKDTADMKMLKGFKPGHEKVLDAKMEHHVDEDDRTPEDMEMLAEGGSIAEMIRAKRKRKMMADGGEVDLKWNGKEHLNEEDDLSFDAGRKDRIMGEDLDKIKQPMDSNEHADKLSDEDAHDMISKIRARMKMRKM